MKYLIIVALTVSTAAKAQDSAAINHIERSAHYKAASVVFASLAVIVLSKNNRDNYIHGYAFGFTAALTNIASIVELKRGGVMLRRKGFRGHAYKRK